ncbi:RNA-binding protein 1 [Zostera marina]|uniref:RNA-binding protein 1 n=1 Tax=Zostera marina TaxID=29655 RepID=A0A0K9PYJ6_ZOSMR|nr:RNA-binding protein 1 [Zostera marina]
MGSRYRSRSRSYSPIRSSRKRYTPSPPPRSRRYTPSPPPRSKRYDDPRDMYRHRSARDRRSPVPSGLLVRNISLDARPEDLRIPFERFGYVKDVYLPKNYYTGEPRGFGFVKFRNPDDAFEAKQHMNHKIIGGREITIVFAEENRKNPQEMRKTARVSGRYMGSQRRLSPSRSPRKRYQSYSRSPSPVRYYARDGVRVERGDYRSSSRSISPSPRARRERRIGEDAGRSRSPYGRSSSRSYSPR